MRSNFIDPRRGFSTTAAHEDDQRCRKEQITDELIKRYLRNKTENKKLTVCYPENKVF